MNLNDKAVFDETGRYRYSLTRWWGRLDSQTVCFVMLNPSTADATTDDPTIRRCISFAKRWGYGSLEVVNLFAWRATNPRDLLTVSDPFGPENGKYIFEAAGRADMVIAAWGASVAKITVEGLKQLEAVIETYAKGELQCLGVTQDGYPRHPLYVLGMTAPRPLRSERARIRLAERPAT